MVKKIVIALAILAFVGLAGTCVKLCSIASDLGDLDACDVLPTPKPVVSEGRVYRESTHGIVALDSSGAELWRKKIEGNVVHLEATQFGPLVVVGEAYKFDTPTVTRIVLFDDTGNETRRWRSSCVPVVNGSEILFYSGQRKVVRASLESGKLLATMQRPAGGEAVVAIVPGPGKSGVWVATRPLDSDEEADDDDGIPEGAATAFTRFNHAGRRMFRLARAHTWIVPLSDGSALITTADKHAVEKDPGLETGEGSGQDDGSKDDLDDLYLLSIMRIGPSGKRMWSRELDEIEYGWPTAIGEVGKPLVVEDRIWVGAENRILVLNLRGEVVSEPVAKSEWPALLADQDGIVAYNDDTFTMHDQVSGAPVWSHEIKWSDGVVDIERQDDRLLILVSQKWWSALHVIEDGKIKCSLEPPDGVDKTSCWWRDWNGLLMLNDKDVLISSDQGHFILVSPDCKTSDWPKSRSK